MSVNKEEFITAKRQAMEKYFSYLNDKQKEAVFRINGPLLVFAGAGSGKTSVLVNRAANMIKFGNAYMDENCPDGITEDDVSFLKNYDGSHDDFMSARLENIIAVDKVKPWDILAITFTNKAAGELKSRLETILGSFAGDIQASTFHSACARILRHDIEKLGMGYTSRFSIYDSADSEQLMKSCFEEYFRAGAVSDDEIEPRTEDKNKYSKMSGGISPKYVLGKISWAKDKLVSPAGYIDFSRNSGGYFVAETEKKINGLYELYQRRLIESNALDFDDLIRLTVELFRKVPDTLKYYRNLFKYVMVDEYQDTNTAQYEFVKLIAEEHGNIFVVGDDDQSIYSFRGADIRNILSFEKQFSSAKVVKLEQNYRSTGNILNAANSLIKHNPHNSGNEKKLWTSSDSGDKVNLYSAADGDKEAKYVSDTILENRKNGMTFKDHAVLYRNNAQSRNIETAFIRSGISYKILGGPRFYDREEVKDIVAYLSVINSPNDIVRFERIVNKPTRGIGPKTFENIVRAAENLDMTFIEVMRNSEDIQVLSSKSAKLIKTAEMFEQLSSFAENNSLGDLIDEILEKTGYREFVEKQNESKEKIEDRLRNIGELKSAVIQYENENGEDSSLEGFLEEVSLYTNLDQTDDSQDTVLLMTVHGAKGLEFPVVFIVGMDEGIFPSGRADDIDEERRLAYVAITRAKKKLHIIHSDVRSLYGYSKPYTVSRFVKEIDDEYLEKIDGKVIQQIPTAAFETSAPAKMPKLYANTNKAPDFAVGDRVLHEKFGEGTVLSVKKISNDAMLYVEFDEVGKKTLMANYARMKKL